MVSSAHSKAITIMDRYFLAGDQVQVAGAEISEGIPVSRISAKNALAAYKLADEIQVVVGASEVEVTTTPSGPVLVARGACFLQVTHNGMVKLLISSDDANNNTTIIIGSDVSEKTEGHFVSYEYNIQEKPDIDLPDSLRLLIEKIPEFLASVPAIARAND